MHRRRQRLSSPQWALLASLYAEVRHLDHPGSLSIECAVAEHPVARDLARRGYLRIHDDSRPDRPLEVFLTGAGVAAARADAHPLLEPLGHWPDDWAVDSLPSNALATSIAGVCEAFLRDQIEAGRSMNTLRRHREALHTLGYEILRRQAIAPDDPVPTDARSHLDSLMLDAGGPVISTLGSTDREQRQLDSTCRALARWVAHCQNPRDRGVDR